MKTIPDNKIGLHLKLGRKLAQFIKTDTYFESRTFDWIRLEKENDLYRASLIRSFDEGDESFIEVAEFETANELDEFENKFLEGNKDEVFNWMESEFQIAPNQFHAIEGLNIKYLELVNANKLGSQLNDEHI